ncbi:MAG: hypothetical protein M3R25_13985, partial [Bacteroidota bacterium]|nr:hypothetical protein [Bacteroidota bacterium]
MVITVLSRVQLPVICRKQNFSFRNSFLHSVYLTLLLIGCSFLCQAQVNAYLFSQSNGTYTPIAGGTVIATATNHTTSSETSLDQGNFTATIPFTFNFNGIGYTT